MRSLGLLFTAVVLGALGCGQLDGSGRAAIPESQLAELRAVPVLPEHPSAPARAGRSFYLRLAWGALDGEGRGGRLVDGAGELSVSEGTLAVVGLLSFRAAAPVVEAQGSSVRWRAQAGAGFTGLVLRVEVPRDDALIALTVPGLRRTFRASELTGGDEASFSLDGEGHALSVSALPASLCPGGFAWGFFRSLDGSVHFGGRLTDRSGKRAGSIRFRAAEDGTLQGQLTDASGAVIASVRGTLVRADDGGSFSAELLDLRGRDLGALTGLFDARGAFQASAEEVCGE